MAESEIQRIARELRELIADLPRYEDALGDIADRALRLNRVIREHRDREDDPEAWRYCDEIIEFTDAIVARARNLAPYIHDTTQIGQIWSDNRVNGGGAGASAGASVLTAASEAPTSQAAPFDADVAAKLPVRPDNKGTTTAYLTTTDGKRPIRFTSGKSGPGRDGPGLDPTNDVSGSQSAREHAEGHAAAWLRRDGAPRSAALYVNNKPCGGRLGCMRTLAQQLPTGTTVTVFWPGGSKVFTGNGKAIK